MKLFHVQYMYLSMLLRRRIVAKSVIGERADRTTDGPTAWILCLLTRFYWSPRHGAIK